MYQTEQKGVFLVLCIAQAPKLLDPTFPHKETG